MTPRRVSIALIACVLSAVLGANLTGCGPARSSAGRTVETTRTVTATSATAAKPFVYTTSVVLDARSSMKVDLSMVRSIPATSGWTDFKADMRIAFDPRRTYWDPNGFILASVTATGHFDLWHVLPSPGVAAPRMSQPAGGGLDGGIPPGTTAIRLIVFAGPTKRAAHRGTVLVVPLELVPVVPPWPNGDLGVRRP